MHRQSGFGTLLTRGKRNRDSSLTAPICQTSTFRAGSAAEFAEMASTARHQHYYTRYGNPTLAQVEQLIAALECGEDALVTASGMGAISTAVLALVSSGDHVVAQTSHYMGTTELLTHLLPRFGIQVTQVDQCATAAFAGAFRLNTRLAILETPSNPLLHLTDLAAVAREATARGIITLVDNTFATPINQRPLELGCDLVAHSATKYLGGHHDLIAGVVVGTHATVEKIWKTHIVLGSVLDPFDAWLLLRGLRTLHLRVARQNETALRIAEFLECHRAIEAVHYPFRRSHPQHQLAVQQMKGGGGVLSFAVKGGYRATAEMIARLQLPAQAVSLGGYESLVAHAAAMWVGTLGEESLAAAGIQPNLVRIAVGLEEVEDLIADLDQALSPT